MWTFFAALFDLIMLKSLHENSVLPSLCLSDSSHQHILIEYKVVGTGVKFLSMRHQRRLASKTASFFNFLFLICHRHDKHFQYMCTDFEYGFFSCLCILIVDIRINQKKFMYCFFFNIHSLISIFWFDRFLLKSWRPFIPILPGTNRYRLMENLV